MLFSLSDDGRGTTASIDKAGRIVISREIRDELRLEAGDSLALELDRERIILRPLHAGTPMRKERVFHCNNSLSLQEANELVGAARAQRDSRNPREQRR